MREPNAGKLEALIHLVRGKRVMFDADLSRLYGVTTAALNQGVRRNRERFPPDFMFRLTRQETMEWMSVAAVSNPGIRKGLRKPPNVFTEQGVAMLSGVLRSPRAVAVNIAIMRAFVRYREALALNRDLAIKLKDLDRRVDGHDDEIGTIMDAMRGLIEGPKRTSSKKIGFRL